MSTQPRQTLLAILRLFVLALFVSLLVREGRSDTLFTNLNPGTDIGTVYGFTVATALTTGGDAVGVAQIYLPQRGLGGPPNGSTQPPGTVAYDPNETLTIYSNSSSGGGTIGSSLSSAFTLTNPSSPYNPYPRVEFQTGGFVLQANT